MNNTLYAILPFLAVIAILPAMAETDTEPAAAPVPNPDIQYTDPVDYTGGNQSAPATLGDINDLYTDLSKRLDTIATSQQNLKIQQEQNHTAIQNQIQNQYEVIIFYFDIILGGISQIITGEPVPAPTMSTPPTTPNTGSPHP